MAGELIPWDSADYLRSKDDVCLYLEAAAEEDPGDGSLLTVALANIARAQSKGNLNSETGLDFACLHDALSLPGGLTLADFMRITRSLGMRLHLAVPPDLEERLAREQEQLAEQVSSP